MSRFPQQEFLQPGLNDLRDHRDHHGHLGRDRTSAHDRDPLVWR
jgi:hypothetical protein